jgi:hypothetical protein
MEAQDYVSKIVRLEKVHRAMVTKVWVTKYLKMRDGNRCFSPVRHFIAHPDRLYGPRTPVPVRFGGFA